MDKVKTLPLPPYHPEEQRVLPLIAEGPTNKEVATQSGLAE